MSDFHPILQDLAAIADELAEVGDDALLAVKAGKRHSAGDEGIIQDIYAGAQQIADLAVQLGAVDEEEEGEDEDAAEEDAELDDGMGPDAMKMLYSDPVMYAQHECGDVMAACSALQALAQLAGSELGEENPGEGTLPQITKAMRLLTAYITKEIDAIDAGGNGGGAKTVMTESADALGGATVPADAKAQTFGGKKRDDLKDEDFGDPKARKFPIMIAADVTDAASLIGKADDPEAVKQRIIAIAKRKGFDIPDAWKEKGATKGIEFIGDDLAVCPGYAVKALDGDGQAGGYLIRFGGDGDLSHWRDVFTPETDYGHAKSSDVWVHHRMLPGLGKRRLNNPAEIGVDDVGVFIKHLLDMRDPYERSLYGLVQQGKLGWSSGAPSHLVERKALGEGRHAIVCWPLGTDSSYTPCPAGGFSVDARAVKSLFDEAGLDLLSALYDEQLPDTKAIELELLAIEAEYAELAVLA